ncbi:MAG TPA: hypothetical protein VJ859_05595 [Allosphingosinicella sp.]|nr:hypothetical protein [Allosphingosinicella sp.]
MFDRAVGTPHSDTALYLQRPLSYIQSMRGLAIAYRPDSLAEAEEVIRANSLRPPIA